MNATYVAKNKKSRKVHDKKIAKLQEKNRRHRFHLGIEEKNDNKRHEEERFGIIGNRSETKEKKPEAY